MRSLRIRIPPFVLAGLCLILTGACCKDCEAPTQNKAIVLKAKEALDNYDYDALDEVMTQDYKRHCQATPDVSVSSLDEFKNLVRTWEREFPDARMTDTVLVAEGDRVAIWGKWTATAGDKRVSVDFGGMHRLRDGKIAETWVTWDNVTMLSQMGMYPSTMDEDEQPR